MKLYPKSTFYIAHLDITSASDLFVFPLFAFTLLSPPFHAFNQSYVLGSVVGLNGLGYLEMRGLGVEKDIEAAVRHFERAADQGSSEGKYNVGVVALAGLDPQKQGRDFRRALLHFATAAASGHVLASHKLAMMTLHGTGVGVWVCGCVGVWMCGCVGVRMCAWLCVV